MNLKEFINPSKEYRPCPFWSWNGEMETAEIETQIRDIQKKGFGGFFIHAGVGLKTKYMSDEWTKAVRRAIEIANELKIEAWIHDEDRYPSGFAGGKITENKKENSPSALLWTEDASSLDKDVIDKVLAYTKKDADGNIKYLEEKPDDLSDIGAFYIQKNSNGHSWYNGQNYGDLLNPETTKTFIETIHEKYHELFKYDFGEYLPGFITDRPHVNRTEKLLVFDEHSKYAFPWTDGFAEYFEKIHGYSPLENLHHLLTNSGDGFKFRHDFWSAVNERFMEAYTIPLSSWCSEHEVVFAGYYPSDNGLSSLISAGIETMSHAEYSDIPVTSVIGRSAQNPVVIKQVTGVANQLDKKRVMSKIFWASGFSLSFEKMKRVIDFNCALGINSFSPQHIQYSMTGDCKRAYPPTFSYHQPYWEKFKVINDYMARCSWAVSQGRSTADVLVMAPNTTAYGVFDIHSENGGEILQSVEHSYNSIIEELLAEHIAFDIGDERIIERHSSIAGDILKVGAAEYSCVILPYSLTWKSSTLDMLESFNGLVIIIGDVAVRVSGAESSRLSKMLEKENVINMGVEPAKTVERVVSKLGRKVSIITDDTVRCALNFCQSPGRSRSAYAFSYQYRGKEIQ